MPWRTLTPPDSVELVLSCRVIFSAAVWLVPGCVSRLMVGLCVVGSIGCSPRRCSWMLSLLSSRLVLRVVAAGLSDVAVLLRPGCAWRVVLVCSRYGRQSSARLRLCGGLYGPCRPRLVAVGCPTRHLFPVGCVLSWLAGRGVSAREVVELLPALCLVRRPRRRPMVGLSCRGMHWAVVAM